MCGIIGVFETENAIEHICTGLSILQNRGQDGFGIGTNQAMVHFKNYEPLLDKTAVETIKKTCKSTPNLIGHALHAIIGEVHQPFVDRKEHQAFVSNNEIYNWKHLSEAYGISAANDSDLLYQLIKEQSSDIPSVLSTLDGVYAFCFWDGDTITCARDLMGIKPLWYTIEDGFAFASERKALLKMGYRNVRELNPRDIITYSLSSHSLSMTRRPFFTTDVTHTSSYEEQKEEIYRLLKESVQKRIPEKPFGVLFSGGVDSTALCHLLNELNCSFTCYIAALDQEGLASSQDLEVAVQAAEEMGLDLKIVTITLSEVEAYLHEIIPLIEDNNVVKVGVALPFFLACKRAQKDGIRVLFSGLGSEEIFGGYQRHRNSLDINKECVSGLLKMYERDLYRDDVVTMYNRIELRLPFLDKELVSYALQISGDHKIKGEHGKYILRETLSDHGLLKQYAWRPKKAAQYGSRFDKALEKLTKRAGLQEKSSYLNRFSTIPNPRLCALISSGKDGIYAAYTMIRQNYPLVCLLTMVSENEESYMYHTPNIDMVSLQAEAMDIPLIMQKTQGVKEEELSDLKEALQNAKDKYQIEGVVTGALYSNYQRERIERICDELGLKIFSPLWHIDQTIYMRQLLKDGFVVTLSSVAAYGLDKSWLGHPIDEAMIEKLVSLDTKIGINVAFEGGEAESLVLDCPLFTKRIEILDSEIVSEGPNNAQLHIKKARLIPHK